MPARPKPVTVVASFLSAATVIALFVGANLLFPSRLLDRIWELNPAGAAAFRTLGRFSGVLLLVLSLALLAGSIGLWRGRRWAWWFALILFSVDISGNVAGYFLTGDCLRSAAGAAISTAFLVILL